jgi:hypothetical protein
LYKWDSSTRKFKRRKNRNGIDYWDLNQIHLGFWVEMLAAKIFKAQWISKLTYRTNVCRTDQPHLCSRGTGHRQGPCTTSLGDHVAGSSAWYDVVATWKWTRKHSEKNLDC